MASVGTANHTNFLMCIAFSEKFCKDLANASWSTGCSCITLSIEFLKVILSSLRLVITLCSCNWSVEVAAKSVVYAFSCICNCNILEAYDENISKFSKDNVSLEQL